MENTNQYNYFCPVSDATIMPECATVRIADVNPSDKSIAVDMSGSTSTKMADDKNLVRTECIVLNAVSGPDRADSRRNIILWTDSARLDPTGFDTASPDGGTYPQEIAKNAECAAAIKRSKVLFFATDGEIHAKDVQRFRAQMNSHYKHLYGVVLFIFTPMPINRTIDPTKLNVSVMAAFEGIDMLLLVCTDHRCTPGTLKVFRSSGRFAARCKCPEITSQTTWDDLPNIDLKTIQSFEVSQPVTLIEDFFAIDGTRSAFSLTRFCNRFEGTQNNVWITDDEIEVFELAFPQLIRNAIVAGTLNDLESVIKMIERHARHIGDSILSLEIPSLVTLQKTYDAMVVCQDKTSEEFKTLKARAHELQIQLRQEREDTMGPVREYVKKILSFCGGAHQVIADARKSDFSAQKFYGSQKITNRMAKAHTVDTDNFNDRAIPVQDGCCLGECQICFDKDKLMCIWLKPDHKLMTSDIMQTFPLSFGHMSKSVIVPGEKPICFDCAPFMVRTPFTQCEGAFAVPLLDCKAGPNRHYLSTLLAIKLTDGKSASFTTRAILAGILEFKDCDWMKDSELYSYFITQLLEFNTTDNMSETGKQVPLRDACRSILEMSQVTMEFPLGALYRQPFAAIEVILELYKRHMQNLHRNHDEILQKAFVFAAITSWLNLIGPNATDVQKQLRDQLVIMMSRSMYNYASGTASQQSAHIMSSNEALAVVKLLFGDREIEKVVKIDASQFTLLCACFLALRTHLSLSGTVERFQNKTQIGKLFTLMMANPKLVQEVDVVKALNDFTFAGCAIVDDLADCPTFVTPYGPSVLFFQRPGCKPVRFIGEGKYTRHEFILALAEGRKQFFRREFKTKDVAPCDGSSIANCVLCVSHFYNKIQGDLDLIPSREHMIQILKALFIDGRGAIHDPALLPTLVCQMYSYLTVRAKWLLPLRSGNDLVRHAEKVVMELEFLGIDTTANTITVDENFPVFIPGVDPITTPAMVIEKIGEATWNELTKPLNDDELSIVFKRQEKYL